jgi:hypothetical protein
VINHSPVNCRKEFVMKNDIVMRWVALAPLALIAIAMFGQWS